MEHVVVGLDRRERRRGPRPAGRPGHPRPAARGHRALTAAVRVGSRRFDDGGCHGPTQDRDHGRSGPHQDQTPLPGTRDELLALHRETRRRRNAAAHGSPEHVAAIDAPRPDRGRGRPHRAGDGSAARLDRVRGRHRPDLRGRAARRPPERGTRRSRPRPRRGSSGCSPTPACARSRRPASSRRAPSRSSPTPTN